MNSIDLHIHTTGSDGTCTPTQIVEQAQQLGLSAIAITDHDTLRAWPEASLAAADSGIELIPGIEISTKRNGAVHILGYYINPFSSTLKPFLRWVVGDRDNRNLKIVNMMNEDGINADYYDMKERFGDIIGRPHFAQILMEHGLVGSVSEAFSRYLDKGKKYYIPREFYTVEQACETIINAQGIPVLAHPFQYKLDDNGLRELIEFGIDHGLKGIECRYSGYTAEQTEYLEQLANEYDLFKTGGSDYHGDVKPEISLGSGKGHLDVPYEYLAELKLAAGSGLF